MFKLILFILFLLCIMYCDETILHLLPSLQTLLSRATTHPNTGVVTQTRATTYLSKSLARDYAFEEWSNHFNSEYSCHVKHNLFRQKVLASLPLLVSKLGSTKPTQWTIWRITYSTAYTGKQNWSYVSVIRSKIFYSKSWPSE